jgi:hypothetical protein
MRTKYPSMFGVLAALLLVVSFIIPANFAAPSPVEAGVCKWDRIDMPGSSPARLDIDQCTEVTRIRAGSDGTTLVALVKDQDMFPFGPMIYVSPLMGLMWSPTAWVNLISNPNAQAWTGICYDIAIAPDNPAFWAVVTGHDLRTPLEVWITENAGGKWTWTRLVDATAAAATCPVSVGAIDVSVEYGSRDVAVGMRNGAGALDFAIFVLQTGGIAGWQLQTVNPADVADDGDIYAMMFSPSYAADGSLAVVFTCDEIDPAGDDDTYYNIALRDIDANDIGAWAFTNSLEVADPVSSDSPAVDQLITADIDLPSDFNGYAASLRRAYVATDAIDAAAASDGIFRFDDNVIYTLMDTENPGTARISTIAYFGTYASGKLLAGEVLGEVCTATVPTWFTDSPTTCPIPCWYPALKPATGAAGGICNLGTQAEGNAQVAWWMNGQIALAATGSYRLAPNVGWWTPYHFLVAGGTDTVCNDETAISISRNNGETWNQIAFIDTQVDWFNDFAISADCNTLYLASVSENATNGNCSGFDSVWRASLNPAVVSPLPPVPPLGVWYERVLTHVTALNCTLEQSDQPLLRLAGACEEPTGQIVGWAARWRPIVPDGWVSPQLWSPDYGDYWAIITARGAIMDFVFESSTVMYNAYLDGTVQRLPYTGTAWATTQPSVNTGMAPPHQITAIPDGQVLVGFTVGPTAPFPAAISRDGGATFTPLVQPLAGAGNIHVAFDPAFNDNSIIYIGDDGTCSVYRNSLAGPLPARWEDFDMMDPGNGAVGCPLVGACQIYGLALAYTGAYGQTALYAAHMCDLAMDYPLSGVWRTLTPLSGLPKPGIAWDFLWVGLDWAVRFSAEPYSLKLCGCCTMDTDTTLYALDWDVPYDPANFRGFLWAFTDCVAKVGPALLTEDALLIGCDPVSGRAQEVNLCWEQLCVAMAYDLEISKVPEFNILVLDIISEPECCDWPAMADCLVPVDLTAPCAYIPAGGITLTQGSALGVGLAGTLECGHTYYWRVKVRACVTGQEVRSPWSNVHTFTVKAGLPVTTPYYGPQLLAPNNGCLGCPVQPASFSWSPFKETSKYKFVLATDAAMTQVVTEAEVTTTAFEYDGALNYSTNYFWRVMALEPAPSDWSATFSFQTESAPPPPVDEAAAPTPIWVWVVIAIGAILVIVTLVLIFKTRRV